jgi:hypothetical protein
MTAPELATEERQISQILALELDSDLGACRILAFNGAFSRRRRFNREQFQE